MKYNCPQCKKEMAELIKRQIQTRILYSCDNCTIFIGSIGFFYSDKWALSINYRKIDDEHGFFILGDSFEECVKKWKLRALW